VGGEGKREEKKEEDKEGEGGMQFHRTTMPRCGEVDAIRTRPSRAKHSKEKEKELKLHKGGNTKYPFLFLEKIMHFTGKGRKGGV